MSAENPPPRQAGPPPLPVMVPIGSLRLDGSPRLAGENELHARLLAEAGAALPPILVHRQTMWVIDGMHRVRAAKLRGEASIEAVFFDGDRAAAFVQSVTANISHGLPLSLADRRAAAERILTSRPEWSDRAIAAATGLSAATVRTIRSCATDHAVRSPARVGRDGKRRPLDTSDGRRHAATLMAQRPDASLREVARAVGVSVGTVRDVRRRLADGDDPVPLGRRAPAAEQGVGHPRPAADSVPARGGVAARVAGVRAPASILEGLRQDPAWRYSERGRSVIRWLEAHLVESGDLSRVAEAVPPHSAYPVAEFAAGCARAWAGISELLKARARESDAAASQPVSQPVG